MSRWDTPNSHKADIGTLRLCYALTEQLARMTPPTADVEAELLAFELVIAKAKEIIRQEQAWKDGDIFERVFGHLFTGEK